MTATARRRRWNAYVVAVVVPVLLARAHVTVAPGCTVPVPVLAFAAAAVVLAALVHLAARTVRDFRSPPPWQPSRAPGRCPRCAVTPRGTTS